MTRLIPPETWQEPINSYLQWLAASKQPESTRKLRSYHLRRFAVSTGLSPFTVKQDDLLAWLEHPGWSKATARSYRTTLRSFYQWAKKKHRVKKSPGRGLPTIHVSPGVPRPAPEDAISYGITHSTPRTRLMIRLGAEAGLRCREIALVHTTDVKRDTDGWYLQVHGKGDKERLVPITGQLAARIKDHPHGYIFPGRIDGHLSAGYVSKLMSQGLPGDVTAHPLRHRFASVAYEGSGRDIRAVQELLGHASVATTQVYTKVPDDAKRLGVLAAAV